MIYNAARWPDTRYAVGAAVFDLNDPRRVLRRLDAPFLEPEEVSEQEGQVNRVVFVEGLFTTPSAGCSTMARLTRRSLWLRANGVCASLSAASDF